MKLGEPARGCKLARGNADRLRSAVQQRAARQFHPAAKEFEDAVRLRCNRPDRIRRTDLCAPSGQELLPARDGPNSNADFIFRTEVVKANGVVTPLIIVQDRTKISGDSLSAALNSAFDTLFVDWKSGELLASFGIVYAYELSPDPEPTKSFVSELPVALLPEKTITAGTPNNIQTKANTWKTNTGPNTAKGEWVVSLTLYSNLEDAKRPLLTIERLFFLIPSH